MYTLLISSSMPYFLASLAGFMLAAIGLTLTEQQRRLAAGILLAPRGWTLHTRLVVGQAAGVTAAATFGLVVLAGGIGGQARMLLLAAGLAGYLYLGWVLPRRPVVTAAQEARRLRILTPALIAFIDVALAGNEPPQAILERFVARPTPRLLPMQLLVNEALELYRTRRAAQPFEALLAVARQRQCRELRNVAEVLAQSEREGADPRAALATQRETLDGILYDEFKKLLNRRMFYLLGLAALAMVVGLLFNLLFVMTGGGSVLMNSGI